MWQHFHSPHISLRSTAVGLEITAHQASSMQRVWPFHAVSIPKTDPPLHKHTETHQCQGANCPKHETLPRTHHCRGEEDLGVQLLSPAFPSCPGLQLLSPEESRGAPSKPGGKSGTLPSLHSLCHREPRTADDGFSFLFFRKKSLLVMTVRGVGRAEVLKEGEGETLRLLLLYFIFPTESAFSPL